MNIRATVTDAELMQAQRESGWTENRTRIAGLLYNSGLSATQVACLLGGITRNAVIGKVHRESLADAGRKLSPCSNGRAKGVRERPIRPPRPARISMRQFKSDEPPPPHIDDAAIPAEQRRGLLDLNDSCCHWPVGDPDQPDFFYCGAVVVQEAGERYRPYCPSHTRRAHDPARGRRRTAEHLVPRLSHAQINHDHRR